MRVNSRVFTERMDMLEGIRIPNCPTQFRLVAENIMNMATKPGYSVPDYNSITKLDKILTCDYWREYDGFMDGANEFYPTQEIAYQHYKNWFVRKATNPDLITRARRWLAEHNYLILKADVIERAYEAEEKFSKAVGHEG